MSLQSKLSIYPPSHFGAHANVNDILTGIRSIFDGVAIGSALYMANRSRNEAGLIGSVATSGNNDGLVSNEVTRRFLRSSDSCGARACLEDNPGLSPSFMHSDHECLNFTFSGHGAALQIVGRSRSALQEIQNNSELQALLAKMEETVSSLRRDYGEEIEKIVPLRENRPQNLIIEFDITAFTDVFYAYGHEKSFDLRKALEGSIQDVFLDRLSPEAELLNRDAGDSFSITINLSRFFRNRDEFEANFEEYLNSRVLPVISDTIKKC